METIIIIIIIIIMRSQSISITCNKPAKNKIKIYFVIYSLRRVDQNNELKTKSGNF